MIGDQKKEEMEKFVVYINGKNEISMWKTRQGFFTMTL